MRRLWIVVAAVAISSAMASRGPASSMIDRHALVTRHNVVLTAFDGERPLQVGNGEFAFGMDITGLQTFAPFNTMTQWGWNSLPLPAGKRIEDFHGQVWDTHGRPVRYPMPDPDQPELSNWLAANPHRINLGRIGLSLRKRNGTPASVDDIKDPHQVLDLWSGLVTSSFKFEGESVEVVTACHPKLDSIAAQIRSPLVKEGRIAVFFDCPEDDGEQFANFVGDQANSAIPKMKVSIAANRADFTRNLGKDSYRFRVGWKGNAALVKPANNGVLFTIDKAEYGADDKWVDVTTLANGAVKNGRLVLRAGNELAGDPIHGRPKSLRISYTLEGRHLIASAPEGQAVDIDPDPVSHRFTLRPAPDSTELSFTCAFSRKPFAAKIPDAETTIDASRRHWPQFWKSGGAIDLSGSKDPRWKELERRIVLSQYLMAVNEAGSLPPQESGLVNNGWYGRFHLEMYWWHAAHWALWNRWPELERSQGLYDWLLPESEKRAAEEGFRGARWPKCIGEDGREWPHVIHSLLIWQQPHPLFFAELDYRAHPNRETLLKWLPLVNATGNFLASYAYLNKETNNFDLGPPVVLASENTDPKTTKNPAFELGYWRFGLRIAEEWRKRLGLPPRPDWEHVRKGLAPLPVEDGLYVLHEGIQDMWTQWNFEHPALSAVYGILPGDGVDKATMRRTLDQICAKWDFNRTWGWDYPMLAMCAARLGEPDRAIDLLLHPSPNFQFDTRGLATGGPFPYFPSNGALLYAVAFMAAGWDGSGHNPAPGFPKNGQWSVKYENLSPAP